MHLLGEHPRAEAWLQAVIDRFRSGVLPHGCGPGGEPVDGPTFWGFENLWLLHFADALRNVTGIDLMGEVPDRFRRPLELVPRPLDGASRDPRSALLSHQCQHRARRPARQLLAGAPQAGQEAGDRRLRDVALSDPRLGRLYRFGMGVKGSTAECMISYGPYAYCYYDPAFRMKRARRVTSLAGRFGMYTGRFAVMRSSHESDAAMLCVSGFDGGLAANFMSLHVQWAGSPLLRTISAFEAQPVTCGSLPCVGGQNETVAILGGVKRTKDWQRLRVSARRTEHEYWISRGEQPVLLVALRRRPRGVRVVKDGVMKDGSPLIRVRGGDVLQYEAERWFRANGGRLRLRFRFEGTGERPGETRAARETRTARETRVVSKKHTARGCCSTPGTASAGMAGPGSTPSPSSLMRTDVWVSACKATTTTW